MKNQRFRLYINWGLTALAVIAWNDGERGVAAFKSLDEVALAGTIAFALQFAQEAKTNVFWNAVIVVDVL